MSLSGLASPLAPKPSPPTPLTPYNPRLGPVITPDLWTEEMFTHPLTPSLLSNQTDPAAFINKRKALRLAPTPAVIVTEYAGQVHSIDPVSPATLSTEADCAIAFAHLLRLGLDSTKVEIKEEVNLGGGAQRYQWNGEDRRQYTIGPLIVGQLLLRYAITPDHLADAKTLEELTAADLLR